MWYKSLTIKRAVSALSNLNWPNLLLIFSAFITVGLVTTKLTAAECDDRPHCIGTQVDKQVYAAWDIDVKPDGHGLPAGEGSARAGETLFYDKCAKCHGDQKNDFKGRSKYPILGPYPTLVGDEPPLDSVDPAPAQTVGSYWPYSSTLFDYIRRAMPFWHSQSLSDDDVYALSAYILYLNGVVEDYDKDFNKDDFFTINMPNSGGFICDPRPDTDNQRCMNNCLSDPSSQLVERGLKITEIDHGGVPLTITSTNGHDCMPELN